MADESVARVSLLIDAPTSEVWTALTDPAWITRYLPATDFVADWRKGGLMRWRGALGQKFYEVSGRVLTVEEGRTLAYAYTGVVPRIEHRVTITIAPENGATQISLTEDNHGTVRELDHANGAWRLALRLMKALLEEPSA